LINANGYFAMQVPNNHMEPTHRAMRDVAGDHRWSVDLSKTRRQPPVLAPQKYYDLLRPYFETIDIWETRYFHEMDSYEAIAEWLKGTGLRPFIAQLAATEQNQFLALFIDELRKHYDVQSDKKLLLPFPRLFIVAQRWKVLSRNQ
jgi:trans-aconitate 2-methyltransferase